MAFGAFQLGGFSADSSFKELRVLGVSGFRGLGFRGLVL